MFKFLLIILHILLFLISPVIAEESVTYENIFYTEKEAIDKVFSHVTHTEYKKIKLTKNVKQNIEKQLGFRITDNTLTFSTVYNNTDILGYAIVLNEQGKYKPITFLTAISPEFNVLEVVVMTYREKIGSEVRKKRFLKQFTKKTKKNPLIVDYDIMGISGATISSWAIASGVKKALVIIEELI